jgi:predicted nucleic acid-binding protein
MFMVYLPDSNVVLRFVNANDPLHLVVLKAVEKLEQTGEELVIFPQILVEFWVVATRPQDVNGLGMTIGEAEQELERLQNLFRVLPENKRIFDEWKKIVTQHKVSGKKAHDARIVAAMRVHKITNILTLNADDFKRYANVSAVTPQEVLGQTN